MKEKTHQGKRRYSLPTLGFLIGRRNEMRQFADESTLTRAGTGLYTADTAALRLSCLDLLTENRSTPNVNQFYDAVIKLGREEHMRTFGKGYREKMYNSKRYLHDIAEAIGIDEQSLRRLMRAYRATAVYEAMENPDLNTSVTFQKTIGSLFEQDLSLPRSQQDNDFVDLMTRWDGSVINFYRLIREKNGNGMWVGRFLPYEMEFFADLLAHLQNKKGASIFTNKIMTGLINKKTVPEICNEITKETNVSIDKSVFDDYINLLSKDF